MKRIWFAVIFLSLTLLLGIYEQKSLHAACDSVLSAAESIEQAIEAEEFDRAAQMCEEAQQKWNDSYSRLSMLINHEVLDEEKTHFRVLRDTLHAGDIEEATEAARELRAGAQLVAESATVTLGNVF